MYLKLTRVHSTCIRPPTLLLVSGGIRCGLCEACKSGDPGDVTNTLGLSLRPSYKSATVKLQLNNSVFNLLSVLYQGKINLQISVNDTVIKNIMYS